MSPYLTTIVAISFVIAGCYTYSVVTIGKQYENSDADERRRIVRHHTIAMLRYGVILPILVWLVALAIRPNFSIAWVVWALSAMALCGMSAGSILVLPRTKAAKEHGINKPA